MVTVAAVWNMDGDNGDGGGVGKMYMKVLKWEWGQRQRHEKMMDMIEVHV